MTDKILIDNNEYTAVKTINLTKEVTVCKRRVEDQTEIADHLIETPAIFEFELELINADNEFKTLDKLLKNKTPFSLSTQHGAYSQMVLTKLTDRISAQQSNSTTASITVQQIMVGKISTAAVTSDNFNESAFQKPFISKSMDQYPGNSTPQSLVTTERQSSILPVRTEDQSTDEYADGLTRALDTAYSIQSGGKLL